MDCMYQTYVAYILESSYSDYIIPSTVSLMLASTTLEQYANSIVPV